MKTIAAIGLLLFTIPALAKEPTYENVLLTKWKMSDVVDYEAQVDDYMKTYRSDVWNRYKNDEFELADKRRETIDMMKQKTDAVDLSEPFVINTHARFGEYDFDHSRYAFSPLSASTYFPIRESYHFGTLRLSIQNPDVIDGIPMEKDQAKAFLAARKDNYGGVDRNVNLSLTLKPVAVDGDTVATRITEYVVQDKDGQTLLSRDLTEQ